MLANRTIVFASQGNEMSLPDCYTLLFPGGLGNRHKAVTKKSRLKCLKGNSPFKKIW